MVCKKEFTPEDDIVFCPDCGAPHHRACWQEEGHCHYEQAHGTDLEWHPKEPEPETTQPEQKAPANGQDEPVIFVNGIAMTRCPNCKKFTPCSSEDMPCRNCGATIAGRTIPFGNPMPQAQPFDPAEPIDGTPSGKWAQVVMQKRQYYLPRFKQLKKQGGKTASWNWAACLLAPYWLAFRKCYLWAAFACFFDLIATMLMAPFTNQIVDYMQANTLNYTQAITNIIANPDFSAGVLLLAYAGVVLLIIRAIIFGLFGNLIYKNECMRRIRRLDAMDPEDAKTMVFRIGGVNILMPIVFYYAVNILQNVITSLL